MAEDLRLQGAALPDDAASDADIPDIGSPEESVSSRWIADQKRRLPPEEAAE